MGNEVKQSVDKQEIIKSIIGKKWPQCENDRMQCATFVYDLHFFIFR
jgi:hypothetical protein